MVVPTHICNPQPKVSDIVLVARVVFECARAALDHLEEMLASGGVLSTEPLDVPTRCGNVELAPPADPAKQTRGAAGVEPDPNGERVVATARLYGLLERAAGKKREIQLSSNSFIFTCAVHRASHRGRHPAQQISH